MALHLGEISCEHLTSSAEDKLSDKAGIWRVWIEPVCVAIHGSKGYIWWQIFVYKHHIQMVFVPENKLIIVEFNCDLGYQK